MSDCSNLRLTTRVSAETAEAAHDFKNILGVVSMLSELAQLNVPVASPASEMLRNIRAACADGNDLCNRMMDPYLSGSEEIESTDVSTLVRAMAPLLDTYIPTKSALQFELTEYAPSVVTSPGEVRQIVMNLVKNAAESFYRSPGCITVAVRLATLGETGTSSAAGQDSFIPERYLCLSVSDTGCGMDDVTRSGLFTRPLTTKEDGHGLGLASVRRIVTRRGGEIQVVSQLGRGTEIRVFLPCARTCSIS